MYFTTIPKIEYPDIQDETNRNTVVLTNILARSGFLREIMENTSLFYDYQVKDGETPELIADKLYGDPQRFWIILLFNDKAHAHYDFPLTLDELNTYVENKYNTSIAVAQTTIHHYEEVVTRTIFYNGMPQSTEEKKYTVSELVQIGGLLVSRPSLPTDPDVCIDASSTTEEFSNGISVQTDTKYCSVTNYTHEFNENEKRRNIRLLDKSYVLKVENEFKRLMK